eukprot:CAMPEP_0197544028 /NCGR_PEP_ID=MMETSP1318-20131121/68554_1 /TAXON_ID=552666 /ORGANISM="Partenskyella glossopodia, Strain RCC365" /LENGTH=701 /DNA_ID=CAMNT_0043103403 /DNA_START=393 /DNA_END=2495 /DNA_ORIENTATION=+
MEKHIRGSLNYPPQAWEWKNLCNPSPNTAPNIPYLPPAKKSPMDAGGMSIESIAEAASGAPPALAEQVYSTMWERFSQAYQGCYMPKSIVLYTSEKNAAESRNQLVALAILLRNSRRGVLHDIWMLDKGFETFSKAFPFQCRSHVLRRVFSGPFTLYPTQILPYVYLGSDKNSTARKQIEQLGVSYIVNCEGETKHKLPMCAYFDLKLAVKKTKSAMNFCTECGTKFRAPVKFCSSCGTRVTDKTLPDSKEDQHLDFRKCVDVLDRCRRDAGRTETGRNILIHCRTGNDIGAAVTIAFLMYIHRDLFRNQHSPTTNKHLNRHRHTSSDDLSSAARACTASSTNNGGGGGGEGQKPWTLKRVLKFVRKHRPTMDINSHILRELGRFEMSLIQEANGAPCPNLLPRRISPSAARAKISTASAAATVAAVSTPTSRASPTTRATTSNMSPAPTTPPPAPVTSAYQYPLAGWSGHGLRFLSRNGNGSPNKQQSPQRWKRAENREIDDEMVEVEVVSSMPSAPKPTRSILRTSSTCRKGACAGAGIASREEQTVVDKKICNKMPKSRRRNTVSFAPSKVTAAVGMVVSPIPLRVDRSFTPSGHLSRLRVDEPEKYMDGVSVARIDTVSKNDSVSVVPVGVVPNNHVDLRSERIPSTKNSPLSAEGVVTSPAGNKKQAERNRSSATANVDKVLKVMRTFNHPAVIHW